MMQEYAHANPIFAIQILVYSYLLYFYYDSFNYKIK